MASPVRVLHAVAGMNLGGYETFIMNVYRQLDRGQVQFDFLSSIPGTFDEEIRDRGGRIYAVPFITKAGPFIYAKGVRRVLGQHSQIRIVHAHMDKFSGMVLQQADKMGVPVRIAHAHGTGNEGGLLYGMVKNHYGKKILPHATDLMACSQIAADWLYGKAAVRATVVPNGIDLVSFTPDPVVRAEQRSRLGLAENTLLVGHVGRFARPKNHAFLLEVFAQVAHRNPAARLLLVGTGPLQADMQQLARRLGISEQVIFAGQSLEIPALLQAMDVFLFPSLHEGMPVSLIEAQAAGLPCVVSDVVATEAAVADNFRYLSLNNPPEMWADAVLAARRSETITPRLRVYDIAQVTKTLTEFYLRRFAETTAS